MAELDLERVRAFVDTYCIPREEASHVHDPGALDRSLAELRPIAQDMRLYLPQMPVVNGCLGLGWVERADGQPMGIAGIYNAIQTPEGLLLSTAMLTRAPGAAMAKIHDREPVVIEPADYAAWLDGADGLDLVTPWGDDAFNCRLVA